MSYKHKHTLAISIVHLDFSVYIFLHALVDFILKINFTLNTSVFISYILQGNRDPSCSETVLK